MKVAKIRFKQYLNFRKDLEIDLTYPSSHEKQGEPLDRVCIIGQSGTGKTTILNLIKCLSFEREEGINKEVINLDLIKDNVEVFFKFDHDLFHKTMNAKGAIEYFRGHRPLTPHAINEIYPLQMADASPCLINFPFHNAEETKDDNSNINSASGQNIASDIVGEAQFKELEKKARGKRVWDFSHKVEDNRIQGLSDLVFNGISIYKKALKRETEEYLRNLNEDIGNAKKHRDKYNSWIDENDNQFKRLAKKCLNPILGRFNLEVDEIDLDSIYNLKHIPLRHVNSKKPVPYSYLSTGAQQIMKTAIPLFFLEPRNSIILFDQPETSLYPDVQIILKDEYENLTTNCQVFYATHSPVVASAFDPWEVVELRFDDKTGKVYRKEFFDEKRKRTKDSYSINPKLLRWDSSYKILFDVKVQGNEERRTSLRKLSELESKIKQRGIKPALKKKLVTEYMRLATLLDWNIS